MSTSISIEDAYREACLAIGEHVVRERFLTAELARLNKALEADRGEDGAAEDSAKPEDAAA